MGVGDGSVVGEDVDLGGGGVEFDGDGVAVDLGADGEVAEELDGQDPCLEGAFLLADEDPAGAGDGEGLAGDDAAMD